ncbi:hypothetical protein dqs_1790 [Azoarcus olearius]|nr:hypothetical protein dqs_1790 [Azoarcus olearius]
MGQHNTTQEHDLEGSVEGLPAFRCHLTPHGGWFFRCTCNKTHTHGAGEGHRAGHCQTHRPYGYFLLAPNDHREAGS